MSYKVVFAGNPSFATFALKSLIADKRFFVSAVITEEDKHIGRKQILTPTPVKALGQENGLDIYSPKNSLELIDILKKIQPDFFVVVAYGHILPKESLEIAKYNINVHGSILPKYRGASPIQSAILYGEKRTGISIMNIEEKMDAGKIWKILELDIKKEDTSDTLFSKFGELIINNFPNILNEIVEGKITAITQDDSKATYCKKINKENGKIDFNNESAENIFNKQRAFTPWPGIYCIYNSKTLKIIKCDFYLNIPQSSQEFSSNPSSNSLQKIMENGKTFEIDGKIYVKTNHGNLELQEVQLEGKNQMNIMDFIKGQKEFIGTILK